MDVGSTEYKEKQKRNLIYLKVLRQMATKEELIFRDILNELSVPHVFQKGFFGEKYHCIVDFYLINKKKTCIEIDGLYHVTENQKIKDKRKDRFLTTSRGFNLIRISNEYIINNKELVKEYISNYIKRNKTARGDKIIVVLK